MYKIELGIEGMMCHKCEAHMNEAVNENLKVNKVESFHDKNLTVIESDEAISEDMIKEVVAKTNYKLVSYSIEEIQKKSFTFNK